MGAKAGGATGLTGWVTDMSDDVGVDGLVREQYDDGQQRLKMRMAAATRRHEADHQEDDDEKGQPAG